jgi:hypothetical protein
MWGTNQLRLVFEEGVLAHQPIDGGLVLQIRIFSDSLALFVLFEARRQHTVIP